MKTLTRFLIPSPAILTLALTLFAANTRAATPAAVTLAASSVSNTVATLNGTVNPGGTATTAWFE